MGLKTILTGCVAQIEKEKLLQEPFIDAVYGNEDKFNIVKLLSSEEMADKILKEFGLSGRESHIIYGHIPVLVKEGQSPIHCNGKVLIIDGGFSKAYQEKTGIAGYTLIYNSYGLSLAEHEPFESVQKAIEDGNDVVSHKTLVQRVSKRKRVADTDIGRNMKEDIKDLEALLKAYREGIIEEKL